MAREYVVEGGVPLRGEVAVSGSKNAVTKMMVASLLTAEEVKLKNVPRIGEVEMTANMLGSLGARVSPGSDHEGELILKTDGIETTQVQKSFSGRNRIPILFAGPLLQRTGEAEIPVLGGDDIGTRPINFHLEGYKALGAEVKEKEESILFTADRLKGAPITLPYPSVMATENLLIAAVLAEGKTVIKNVAIEPEIIDLVNLLQKMGAIIFQEADRVFVVEGVEELGGAEHSILPDRLEAASFASAAVATKGDVLVRGARQQDMRTFLNVLRKIGGGFEIVESGIRFRGDGDLKAVTVETGVHPGFMTDWQPPFSILLTQCEGTSVVHETVYEQRFGYVEVLKKMGAHIELLSECLGGHPCRFAERYYKHSALIKGPTALQPADVEVPDIRAGFAYVIAALVAEGTSRINGVEVLERGYENLTEKLSGLGASIKVDGEEK